MAGGLLSPGLLSPTRQWSNDIDRLLSPVSEDDKPAARVRNLPPMEPQTPRRPDKAEGRHLIESLERHYAADLKRISPQWVFSLDGPTHPAVNVAETVGVPGIVLGAILAGKCRDQRIPVTAERQKRFSEWLYRHCGSLWFSLHDSGSGPECAKGVVLALALNDRYTSLNLSCNTLCDAGAAVVARLLPEHQSLIHLDLSANDIGNAGANAIFEALLLNRSVTYLDLSSRAGSLRNHFGKQNAGPLEQLLATNPVLAKLCLNSTCLGAEGTAGLARGLTANTTLSCLDLAGNDLGPRGVAALAEALCAVCGLEELNLCENHLGDEGLAILATKLGAPPPLADSPANAALVAGLANVTGTPPAQVQASLPRAPPTYYEALAAVRRSVGDLPISDLTMEDAAERKSALARVSGTVASLAAAVETLPEIALPRLRVLLLGGNGASSAGASRIEDALQMNNTLERLTLDRADQSGAEGAKSLVTALVLNTGLRSLSLSHCALKNAGVLDLSKSLCMNRSLESLNLQGNRFGANAAAALGAVLSSGCVLRQLNLSGCHLEDTSGIALANGLVGNTTLETLNLRDNLLRDGAGRALADALRRHACLTTLILELNSIDFRFLSQIKQLLDKNQKVKEDSRSDNYRKRIEKLKECQQEVAILHATINRNHLRKRKAKLKQAALLQEFKDVEAVELSRQQTLEGELQRVRDERSRVAADIEAVRRKLEQVRKQGDFEVSQLQSRIGTVEDLIRQHEERIALTRQKQEEHRQQCQQELAVLNEESETAEKERASAAMLCEAAQRNLDSFGASLRSIEDNIAGGADPRNRLISVPAKAATGTRRRSSARSGTNGGTARPPRGSDAKAPASARQRASAAQRPSQGSNRPLSAR
eukprot:TRINITY_DN13071_c0_g1_i1.p1 TRINITY_DN13071_c0_g1~~TRINITY_DN13071_c0_g1_i1.p1  ORF type:complete len:881 (+),score=220.15 TRINITY_DN13071_c0_g1_i1:104-2746(+)